MKRWKSLLASGVLVALVATQSIPVEAASVSWKNRQSTARLFTYANVNVYNGCTTDTRISTWLGQIPAGQLIQITGYCDTGSELWYQVEYNGLKGYTPRAGIDAVTDWTAIYQLMVNLGNGDITIFTEDTVVQFLASVLAKPGMTPMQIAANVHDYLCMTMEYDEAFEHVTTYDALFYGTGVCQGYANAFERIMDAAGIETDFIGGIGVNGQNIELHAWNRCLVDGVYYYVDCTWDDEGKYAGTKYFWTTDETFGNTHLGQYVNPVREQ